MRFVVVIVALLAVLACLEAKSSSFWLQGFNIQVFGMSKLSKTAVFEKLLAITKRVDFIVIQEVRDKTHSAVGKFVEKLNYRRKYKFDYVISERLGRTNSKEQYAFVFKKDFFKIEKTLQYADPNGWFERPPFGAFVKRGNLRFFVMVCHVSPRHADAEIGHLKDVFDFWANDTSLYGTHRDIIKERTVILGDMNADCGYLSKRRLSKNPLWTDNRFHWILTDEDTTLAKSVCNYDRFVVTNQMLPIITKTNVFKFDEYWNMPHAEAIKISDHYPIEMRIKFTYDDDDEMENDHKSILAINDDKA